MKTAAPTSPDQLGFDFLVPYSKPLLRPDEVMRCLDRERQHIYDLIAEGKLEGHEIKDREKARKRVTRRSVLLYLAETATYDPSQFTTRVEALLPLLDAAQLRHLLQTATALLARKPLHA